MKVKKVKGVANGNEVLGVDVDGFFISFGEFVPGPNMEKVEDFIDECVGKFDSAHNVLLTELAMDKLKRRVKELEAFIASLPTDETGGKNE